MLFHIGDLITITTRRLVAPTKLEGVYKILNFLTGESLFTPQLSRAMKFCAPSLLENFPFLASIQPPDFESEQHVWDWLNEQAKIYGSWHEVQPLDVAYFRMHPIEELEWLRGSEEGIISIQIDS